MCLISLNACRVRFSFSVGVVFVDLCEEFGKGQIDGGVGDLKPLLGNPVSVAAIPADARFGIDDPEIGNAEAGEVPQPLVDAGMPVLR
jgi:hypothetical protein